MMPGPPPTRQRLLDAGMHLFARQGFTATTVGQIEAAAGLRPRRGGLYKHFSSKDALLEQALRRHLDSVATGVAQLSGLDLASLVDADRSLLRPLIAGFGRWFLAELDRQRELTHVLEHDAPRLGDLTARVRSDIIDAGYRAAADLVGLAIPDADDPHALAVLLLGGLVALRRTSWTFGAPPLDVDDERALTAWTDVTLAWFDAALGRRRAD